MVDTSNGGDAVPLAKNSLARSLKGGVRFKKANVLRKRMGSVC